MSYNLSRGALKDILTDNVVDRPILQVLGHKKITGAAERYRLLLSDGVSTYSSAMLATQHNHFVLNGDLEDYTVVCLDKYTVNVIKNDKADQPDRRVLIILDISIIASGQTVGKKLGSPVAYQVRSNNNSDTPNNNGTGHKPQNNLPPPQAKPQGQMTPVKKGPGFGNVGSGQNAPNTPGGTPSKVHAIASLTPYQNRWCIKARVTNKGSLRTYSNARGEGKLFNVHLLDDSGEIRATLFNREVDKFLDVLEMNKVYYIRKATLKTADKRYSSLNNDYEMTFNGETEVIPCDDDSDMPSVSFNFVPINELDKHEANSTVDVIGIVKNAAELSTVTSRQTNKELKKRDLQLVDENQVMIRMTIWGSEAENFDGTGNPVMAVKGCRLSDWGGRSLSILSSSQVLINPDIPEAHSVRGWFDSVGQNVDFNEFRSDGQGGGGGTGYSTNWKSFAEAKAQPPADDKADYYTVKASTVYLRKENCMYMACPQQDCNKKVIDQANGFYRCEKCNQEFPNYKWRMILSVNLADHSDNQWATCFQETAETLLGKPGNELGQLKDQDENGFDKVFSDATFESYIFKLRSKMETYNDEARLKTVCVSATPLDYAEYNKKLIGDIEKLLSC